MLVCKFLEISEATELKNEPDNSARLMEISQYASSSIKSKIVSPSRNFYPLPHARGTVRMSPRLSVTIWYFGFLGEWGGNGGLSP